MYLERAYRQVTFVSYGNEFLSGSVDSEVLDRHPLLFTHFPILRDAEKGTLLAGSASHLLNHLKAQGLYKISLHLASDVITPLADSQFFDFDTGDQNFCILCHFPNQLFKVLIHGDEKPLWQEYDTNQCPLQSNYNNYHNNVENYVLMNVSPEFIDKILVDLQPLPWKLFYEEYQNQVYAFEISKRYGTFPVPLTESNCYVGDSYKTNEQYPLLPFNLRHNYTSNLIINAAALNQHFNVESHGKNEYAEYWHMSENEKINFTQASHSLDEFFPVLLKHSANHYKDAAIDPLALQNIPFISTSNLENIEPKNSKSNEVSAGFKWFRLIKFLWFMLWCYCALWTLAYFTVRWGNILILGFACLYALYKILPKLDKPSE